MTILVTFISLTLVATVYSNTELLAAPQNEDGLPSMEPNVMDIVTKINNDTYMKQAASMFSAHDQSKIIVDGKEMFEGDIVSTPELREQITAWEKGYDTGNKFDAATRGKWPNGEVPYVMGSLNNQARIMVRRAIQQYNSKTCIKWVPRKRHHRNYVNMMHGGGCYSMIGMTGRGKQDLSLGHGCYRDLGTPIHEMMHAVGFFHEQSRRDRDRYIRINWRNMNQKMRYNFEMYKPSEASNLNQPYDKKSVMHYGNYAFSINRRPTIVSLANANEKLGQRIGFSEIDVKQLNIMYGCESTTKPTKPRPTTEPETGGGETDSYKFCPLIKSFCTTDWPKKNCKGTCKPPKTCVDKNGHCEAWSKGGYCEDAKYEEYMKLNCKKSCTKFC